MQWPYFPIFSLVLIIMALAAFYFWYERRRVAPAEIAVIATLAALAGAGRVPFAAIPGAQPTTFLVLVCGRIFGSAAGFIIGSIAAFSSNFFLGHGPWTPWQMLAWGLAGACGGFFSRGKALFPRWTFTVLAFLWGFIFGWFLNLWHWFTFVYPLTFQSFVATMLTGFSFDLTHAISNALFMVFFGPELAVILHRFKRRLSFYQIPAKKLTDRNKRNLKKELTYEKSR